MKTAIIYSSKNGTTAKVANMIAAQIGAENDVSLISLSETPDPDLSSYGKVILGTSVYAGKPRKEMSRFCREYRDVIENKIIGLFVCGMQPEKKEEELKDAYPEYLHNKANAEAFVGGELLFEKMSFFIRRLMKRMAKTDTSVSKLDNAAIEAFSVAMG